jgi:hypothetical protein
MMNTSMKWISTMLLVISMVQTIHGAILGFDDLPQSANVGDHYASLGVHFSLTDFGVQEGLANGDSGNWGLNGTSGPFFEGFNGSAPFSEGYSMTLTFDAPVTAFALDVSRSNGSDAGDTFTVSGFLGVSLVDTRTVTLGEINNWTTISLQGACNRVQWSGGGIAFHPYGVDNINFAVVPEPSIFALLIGAGVAFLGLRKLR